MAIRRPLRFAIALIKDLTPKSKKSAFHDLSPPQWKLLQSLIANL
jgi:hypothetical protein